METLPISKVKDRLNEYVDAVGLTHDQVTITKNGSPAAVLVGAEQWEALQETLFWLSQHNIHEVVTEADGDVAAGRTHGEDELRAEYGVPPAHQLTRGELRGPVHRSGPPGAEGILVAHPTGRHRIRSSAARA